MTLKLLGAAAAAAVLALSGCSNWGGKDSGASGGASGTGPGGTGPSGTVPSSQDNPAGSTATPTSQEKRVPRGGY